MSLPDASPSLPRVGRGGPGRRATVAVAVVADLAAMESKVV